MAAGGDAVETSSIDGGTLVRTEGATTPSSGRSGSMTCGGFPRGFPVPETCSSSVTTSQDQKSPHSTVFEITTPIDDAGGYVLTGSDPYGPTTPTWSYTAPEPTSFHSPFISGAHRLPDGHTVITSGGPGRFFEVTRDGEIVWEYRSPNSGDVDPTDDTMQFLMRQFPYAAFRATKILPDHPALAGRGLVPLNPQPAPVAPPEPTPES